MKFSGSTDFEVPLANAFDAFADFERFERHGMRAGAEVMRVDDLNEPNRGMMWIVKADFRGRSRKVDIELIDYEPHQHLEYRAVATGFDGIINIDLVSLSVNRSRAIVSIEIKPTSLSARLVLQSARLAKSSITKRFKSRLDKFGRAMEENYQPNTMA